MRSVLALHLLTTAGPRPGRPAGDPGPEPAQEPGPGLPPVDSAAWGAWAAAAPEAAAPEAAAPAPVPTTPVAPHVVRPLPAPGR